MTGTFTLWGRSDNTGDADMLVRRGDPATLVCTSESVGVNEHCGGIESGSVEVIVAAPTEPVKIALDYALAIPALAEGNQYEAVVAVDLDYLTYEELGSLQDVQNYVAELFAYTNVVYEREVETKLVVGDMRVRQTADDDPYHTDEELETNCRLAELQNKWMESEELSQVERSTVAHLTAIPFGGLAALGGLCEEPSSFAAQEIEGCPFDRDSTGGFSVSGTQGEVSAIGTGQRSRTWFPLMSWVTTSIVNILMAIWASAVMRIRLMAATLKQAKGAVFGQVRPRYQALVRFKEGAAETNGTIMSYCHQLLEEHQVINR